MELHITIKVKFLDKLQTFWFSLLMFSLFFHPFLLILPLFSELIFIHYYGPGHLNFEPHMNNNFFIGLKIVQNLCSPIELSIP